ncbi:MAG: DinB family protein [Spirochaetes bacterium]|nr:DinB family protein [Spirochaetota bacterium]MBN2772221.1 DinB family protein [Spirochaetota bacterium]
MKNEQLSLESIVKEIYSEYAQTDEATASINPSPDSWSIKEIFGHLIDSAANNYQRFVRLQEVANLDFPGYDYNWIKIVRYNDYPFERVISLWKEYNLLLAHIAGGIEKTSLTHFWKIDGKELSLEFLVKDYLAHMKIHLEQLKIRLAEVI